jgi:hypothetical protein
MQAFHRMFATYRLYFTFHHTPNMPTGYYTPKQREADLRTLASASEVIVSKAPHSNGGASANKVQHWVITIKGNNSFKKEEPSWTAALRTLAPQFTRRKVPMPTTDSVNFLAESRKDGPSEKADLETLARASEVCVSKAPHSNEGASTNKIQKWVITIKGDNSFKREEKSWAAVLRTLTPQFTHLKVPMPTTNSVSISAIPKDTEEYPSGQSTVENRIFAKAKTVTVNRMTQEEYLKSCPPGTQISSQACPYHLHTEDGVPFTEVKVATWIKAVKHLHPGFAMLPDPQPKEACTVFKPVVTGRKSRPRRHPEAESEDVAQAEGAGGDGSDAGQGVGEGGTASQQSTLASGVEAESELNEPWGAGYMRDGNFRSYAPS